MLRCAQHDRVFESDWSENLPKWSFDRFSPGEPWQSNPDLAGSKEVYQAVASHSIRPMGFRCIVFPVA
jgi:hypothetical protein